MMDGICSRCQSDYLSSSLPPYIYCSHRQTLAVRRQGTWEAFFAVRQADVERLLASCFPQRTRDADEEA